MDEISYQYHNTNQKQFRKQHDTCVYFSQLMTKFVDIDPKYQNKLKADENVVKSRTFIVGEL